VGEAVSGSSVEGEAVSFAGWQASVGATAIGGIVMTLRTVKTLGDGSSGMGLAVPFTTITSFVFIAVVVFGLPVASGPFARSTAILSMFLSRPRLNLNESRAKAELRAPRSVNVTTSPEIGRIIEDWAWLVKMEFVKHGTMRPCRGNGNEGAAY
jgi:hypothetical protein